MKPIHPMSFGLGVALLYNLELQLNAVDAIVSTIVICLVIYALNEFHHWYDRR